jgi:hypothetical protein
MRKHLISIVTGVVLALALMGAAVAQEGGPGENPDVETPQAAPAAPAAEEAEPAEPEAAPEAEPAVVEPAAIEGEAALVSSNFTYQGQLKRNGTPVNASCDFIFDIYDVLAGGSAMATDNDAGQAVTNGLFTAVIDVPASVIDGNARFLEIRVRCPPSVLYTTLAPRQALRATPYALGLRLPFSHTITNASSPIFTVNNSSTSTDSPSFLGTSAGGDGVRGISTGAANADNGVYGATNSTSSSEAGVKGVSTNAAAGGYFSSVSGYGVHGSTGSATDYGGYFSNSSATSGAALYANGDAKQSLTGDGFVKAAVYVNCGSAGTGLIRSFNNVNTTAITVINGASAGRCTVDFGFDVTDRYIVATAYGTGVARLVTYDPGAANDRLDFFRFDTAGAGVTGNIMVLIY